MKNLFDLGGISAQSWCVTVAPCYGRLMDNVALIQLQMNRQDRGIKNEEGARGVWIMHTAFP